MAELRLDKISVYGFKSIRALENFEIRPLNVLIGANGSGKSNFIALFRLLNAIKEQRLGVYSAIIGADRLLYYGRKHTEKLSILLEYRNQENNYSTAYQLNIFPRADESLFVSELNEIFEGQTYNRAVFRGYDSDSKSEGLAYEPFSATLTSVQVYHFHDTSETAKVKGRGDLHDNRRLAADAGNLAAFLYYLQQKHSFHYEQIVATIRRVAPFFDDFILEPLLLAREEIRLEWRDKSGLDMRFTAHDLSDGTLRFICLATLLLQPELPSLILIDEPELGLHPSAINLLADLLIIASKKSKVIVSTQSVTLVDEFDPEHLVIVERKDRQSSFERLDTQALEAWLEAYSVGELWEKNVLGGRPKRELYP